MTTLIIFLSHSLLSKSIVLQTNNIAEVSKKPIRLMKGRVEYGVITNKLRAATIIKDVRIGIQTSRVWQTHVAVPGVTGAMDLEQRF